MTSAELTPAVRGALDAEWQAVRDAAANATRSAAKFEELRAVKAAALVAKLKADPGVVGGQELSTSPADGQEPHDDAYEVALLDVGLSGSESQDAQQRWVDAFVARCGGTPEQGWSYISHLLGAVSGERE